MPSVVPSAQQQPDLASHDLLSPPAAAAQYEQARRAFLHSHGDAYGYGASHGSDQLTIDAIRATELTRLHGAAYLDHAGASLYSEAQIGDALHEFQAQLLRNPHSSSSSASSMAEAHLRQATLDMLSTSAREYEVVLTAGATAALRLLGEAFPWCPGGSLAYTLSNHNSVLGLREYALAAGASAHVVDLHQSPQPPQRLAPPPKHKAAPSARQPRQQQQQQQQPQATDTVERFGPYVLERIASLSRPAARMPAECGSCSGRDSGMLTQSHEKGGARNAARCHRRVAGSAGAGGDGVSSLPCCHLLALPAECNFTGRRYDVAKVVAAAHSPKAASVLCGSDAPADGGDSTAAASTRCLVLLDAAKACATDPPNLSAAPADFVVLSYYKIFGYPTGLGALVIRKDALPLLQKRYFSGGTVAVSVADEDFVVQRPGHAGLEDGTLPFAAIMATRHGFHLISRLGGFSAVSAHAHSVASYLAASLSGLRHGSGAPVVQLYSAPARAASSAAGVEPRGMASHAIASAGGAGDGKRDDNGPTVAFNVLRPDGSHVGYAEVCRLAEMHRLHLRGGCFCNPGMCARVLQLTGDDLRANFDAGHVCWDDADVINGRPTGAVRASMGALSTFEEAHLLVALLLHYFVLPAQQQQQPGSAAGQAHAEPLAAPSPAGCPAQLTTPPADSHAQPRAPSGVLTRLCLYPIKSCAAQSVSAWPVGPAGLLLDREWALVGDDGRALTQKVVPAMATLAPRVDLAAGTLTLSSPRAHGELVLVVGGLANRGTKASTDENRGGGGGGGDDAHQENVRVCGDTVCGVVVGQQQLLQVRADGEGDGGSRDTGSADAVDSSDPVRSWLAQALGVPCRLVRQAGSERFARHTSAAPAADATTTDGPAHALGFANDGQYLLVNSASVEDLQSRLRDAGRPASGVDELRFRPNLVVSGFQPYEEDTWQSIRVGDAASLGRHPGDGNHVGEVTLDVWGGCPRCDMVQIDQTTGERQPGRPDVLLELAQYRRLGGRMRFGVLLGGRPTAAAAGRWAGASNLPRSTSTTGTADEGSSSVLGGPDSFPSTSAWLHAHFGSVLIVGAVVMPS